MSGGEKEVDKMDDELSRREMEREYRQILDGGYVRNIVYVYIDRYHMYVRNIVYVYIDIR